MTRVSPVLRPFLAMALCAMIFDSVLAVLATTSGVASRALLGDIDGSASIVGSSSGSMLLTGLLSLVGLVASVVAAVRVSRGHYGEVRRPVTAALIAMTLSSLSLGSLYTSRSLSEVVLTLSTAIGTVALPAFVLGVLRTLPNTDTPAQGAFSRAVGAIVVLAVVAALATGVLVGIVGALVGTSTTAFVLALAVTMTGGAAVLTSRDAHLGGAAAMVLFFSAVAGLTASVGLVLTGGVSVDVIMTTLVWGGYAVAAAYAARDAHSRIPAGETPSDNAATEQQPF